MIAELTSDEWTSPDHSETHLTSLAEFGPSPFPRWRGWNSFYSNSTVVYHLHKISGSFPIWFWEISKWYECVPFVSYRNVPDSCPGSQRFPHFLKHCSPLATRPAFAENCCAIFSNTSFFVAFPTPNKCLLSSHVEIKRRTSASPHRSRLFPGCTGSCKYSVSADEVDKQEGSKATAEKSCMNFFWLACFCLVVSQAMVLTNQKRLCISLRLNGIWYNISCTNTQTV